jgi:hypothetical protein
VANKLLVRLDDSVGRRQEHSFVPPRLIPQRQLYAVPEPQFVVDRPEIILDDVFGCSDLACNFFVFESLCDEGDDALFSLAGVGSAVFSSDQSRLLYRSVASFTRLTPPLIPKRVNSRLKCAFTVRRAIFSSLEISSLSQPCRSSSTTCCSRGRSSFSFIKSPLTRMTSPVVPSRRSQPCGAVNFIAHGVPATLMFTEKLSRRFPQSAVFLQH